MSSVHRQLRLLLPLLFLAACRAQPPVALTSITDLNQASPPPGEPLQVVVTTSILADIVGQVGGDNILLTTLVPAGLDPHSFEPTPQDRRALDRAHLILINGLGLEPFVDSGSLLAEVQAPVASLSEGITPIFRDDDRAQSPDPHIWMDPANVRRWVENAARALAALDPAKAEAYRSRAAGYLAEVNSLEGRLQEQVDRVPQERRRLVTDHESLGYFAARYGFTVIGTVIPAPSSSAEASARDLAELEEAIQREGVRAVFVSSSASPDVARRVAEDTGARLVPLYLESLTGPDGPAPTYLALMEYNVVAIVEALLG
ncbi:MAG TPA: zinc ABC transporter substrate-binding protein [Anaerolineales bacterium]|nr:zinc ABC transporter substrate-binding protein [Anaerolineales bacterium]